MATAEQQVVALRIFFFGIPNWKKRVYIFHLRFVKDGELAGHVTWRGESNKDWNQGKSFHSLAEVREFCTKHNFKLTYLWVRWKQPFKLTVMPKRGK